MLRTITNSLTTAIAASTFLFILSLAAPLDVLAAQTTCSRYVYVPVYYVTDRNKEGESFGSERKYFSNCKHDMSYGTAYVPVPNAESVALGEDTKCLGWLPCPDRPPKISRKDEISEPSAALTKKKFFNLIETKLQSSGTNEMCVFVHGADDGFEDAALDAAALSYYIRRPLIMYSWPSVPKMMKYVVDSNNSEWSQAHFNMFARDLIAFNKVHPIDLTLISHSMGNRLVVRAVEVLAGTHVVKDLELVSPDIDEETFKHYVMNLRHARGTVRLYVSYKDKMLPLSQFLHGGYYRLGEGVGTVLGRALPLPQLAHADGVSGPSSKEPDTAPIRITATANEAGEPATIDDAVEGESSEEQSMSKIESIDFSALDQGFSGHTIPFKLIASMIHSNQPGPGYRMVPTKYGRGSKLARMFAGRQTRDQSGHSFGDWERVIKDPPRKGP